MNTKVEKEKEVQQTDCEARIRLAAFEDEAPLSVEAGEELLALYKLAGSKNAPKGQDLPCTNKEDLLRKINNH